MSLLSSISLGVWILVGIYGLLTPQSVKISGLPVSPFVAMIMWLVFYPCVGVLFVILGHIGNFMAAPLNDLLTQLIKR